MFVRPIFRLTHPAELAQAEASAHKDFWTHCDEKSWVDYKREHEDFFDKASTAELKDLRFRMFVIQDRALRSIDRRRDAVSTQQCYLKRFPTMFAGMFIASIGICLTFAGLPLLEAACLGLALALIIARLASLFKQTKAQKLVREEAAIKTCYHALTAIIDKFVCRNLERRQGALQQKQEVMLLHLASWERVVNQFHAASEEFNQWAHNIESTAQSMNISKGLKNLDPQEDRAAMKQRVLLMKDQGVQGLKQVIQQACKQASDRERLERLMQESLQKSIRIDPDNYECIHKLQEILDQETTKLEQQIAENIPIMEKITQSFKSYMNP